MKKNIVLGTAIGYEWDNVKLFVKTLRKYSNCDVCFLVNNVDKKTKEKLKKYKIKTIKCNLKPLDFRFRYIFFLKFIKKNKKLYSNIFFTDVRDVFFQQDPFKKKIRNINFFEEEKKLRDCKINSLWFRSCFGEDKFNKYKNQFIVCSGTVMGKVDYMISYFNHISNKLRKLKMKFSLVNFFLIRQIKYGLDQPACHHIVYTKLFKNQNIYPNKSSYVATVGHMKKLSFDKKNRLLNSRNEIYSVVHQYDRYESKFKKYIENYL